VRVPFRPCRRDNGVVGCWINLKRARLSGSSSSRAAGATRNNIISSSAGPHNTKLGFALCVCFGLAGRSRGCELIIHTCSKVCECGPKRNALSSCIERRRRLLRLPEDVPREIQVGGAIYTSWHAIIRLALGIIKLASSPTDSGRPASILRPGI
jgi:hypothetical protein